MTRKDRSRFYTVPDWFASANFKTHQEIQTAESPFDLIKDDEENSGDTKTAQEDSDCNHHAGTPKKLALSKDWLDAVRDTLAASLMTDGNGSTQAFQPGIVLRRLQNDAGDFTDSIVRCLAEQLGAHVITLDVDEMDDLCWDFLEQSETEALDDAVDASAEVAPADPEGLDQGEASDNGPIQEDGSSADSVSPDLPDISATRTEFEALDADERSHPTMFYFGTRCRRKSPPEWLERNREAWSALIHGLQLKAEDLGDHVSEASSIDHTKSPVLLYVPDADAFEQLRIGRRFFTRMRDFIRTQREHGQKLAMVLSADASSTSTNCRCDSCTEEYSYGWSKINTKLQIGAVTTFKVPRQREEYLKTTERGDERKKTWIKDSNVRTLKISLRSQLPKSLQGVCLKKTAVWDFPANGKALEFIQSRLLSDEEIQKATRQILGRSWQKEMVDTEDIFVVLARVFDQSVSHSDDGNSDDGNSDDRSEDTEAPNDEKSAWETKIDSIRNNCNKFEQPLLEGVVNPEKLTSGYDSVVVDKGTKQLVAKLLALSASRSKPNSHPLLSQVQSRGAMFYGPPGTGKTHLCRAIAKESDMTMLAIDGANVISKWVGESEKYIRAAFTLAEKLHPCIIFLDEVDSLFGHRHSEQHSWERAVVTQFLKEMDGLAASDKAPFVIVATNRPGDLDEAFIRRLSHKVLFSLPTLEQRKDIFKIFLKDEDLSDDIRLDSLAADTEGFSGSDIRSLCGAAALAWSVEQSDKADASGSEDEPTPLRLTAVHFQTAFERSMPSVSTQSTKDIESFEKRFSQKRAIGKRFGQKMTSEKRFDQEPPAKIPFKKEPHKPIVIPKQAQFYDPRIGRQQ